jgi:4-aminobutyrate aminotransferase/4-aminobutyrate aminotransferase/(S)-3-amino-2-methylpropionate transaminase
MTVQNLTAEDVIQMQDRYLMKSVEAWNDRVFVEGHGATLIDIEGEEYLDCFSGVSVLNIGHTHPRMVEAVRDQVGKLTHLSTLYRTVPMPLLAKKLSQIAPMDRGQAKVFFCNSGSEANEHAMTLARIATKKFELFGMQNGFYGRGGFSMSVTGMGAWRSGLGPFMPGTLHLPHYHCYRCALGHKDPTTCGIACANYLKLAIKSQTSNRVAAVVAEAIQGIGGIVVAPPDYFKTLKPILDENGVLLIVDEVQSGFGRTGKWFGIEHYGIEPDVITLAKALGGGMPLGAVVARSEVADAFQGPDFSTFGGNPVSCRAAIAGIEVIEDEKLAENATIVGQYLKDGLNELSKNHPCLDDVQGLGLMIGAEIVTDKASRTPAPDEALVTIMDEALKAKVLIGRGGLYYNRIRFQPPLCIKKEQADSVLEAFEGALSVTEKTIGQK